MESNTEFIEAGSYLRPTNYWVRELFEAHKLLSSLNNYEKDCDWWNENWKLKDIVFL